ncbi:MAG: NBR1-Ig-like domain-containing protein [Anaerolineales bacterium]|nr:NBR1-Ig-like domain-containing protein [Anaerolineales bacterium]
MIKKTMILIALVFLVAACLPAQQAPADVQSQVNTAVAQTLEANNLMAEAATQTMNAQVSAASPTLAFTLTLEPTFEPILIITDTPLPPTFTSTPFPPPPPAQSTSKPYSCFVSTLSPSLYEEIKADSNFEIKWSVKNTGTRAWDSGVDVKYAGGVQMTNATRVEIPVGLQPGQSYKISLNAKAPKGTGVRQMTWIVEGQMCYAQVVITVK